VVGRGGGDRLAGGAGGGDLVESVASFVRTLAQGIRE